MYTLRFENGKAYSDEEIIFFKTCEFCQIKTVPRDPQTGEVRMPDLVISRSTGIIAHWKACPCTAEEDK